MTASNGTVDHPNSLDARINAMFTGDLFWAWGFVAVLWAVYLFVFYEVTAIVRDADIWWALAIGGGLVLLFNTAAIIALAIHYAHDKRFIYGLDIRHLDEMRASRRI